MPLGTEYHAFVDESGDDGFSPTSTEWLILSAVIIHLPSNSDLALKWIGCKRHVHRKADDRLHWKCLAHHAKKAILTKMEEIDFQMISVASHKKSLSAEQTLRLKCPTLYSFATKFLVERLSWFARDQKSKINITFENRPQVDFQELKHYIFHTLPKRVNNNQISYESLNGFNSKHRTQERRLEIADVAVGCIANGLNPDEYGNVETSYALKVLPRIWNKNGKLYSYGMKHIPNNIDRSRFALFREFDEMNGK